MDFREILRGGTDQATGDFGIDKRVYPEKPSDDPRDIPCVRLNADQVVEITADDYSLKIFNLTRIKPMTIKEIIEKEPESESGIAEEIIRRFLKVELLEEHHGNRYYSKFPENYVNFTDHPYDEEFESDKDTRIFKLMKKMAGNKDFWKSNSYFSEDGYFTEEQSMHIKKCLQDIKFYIKQVIQENNKNGNIEGLTFRRHKFYDLTLTIFAMIFSMVIAIFPQTGLAGNDPGIIGGDRSQSSLIAPLTVDQVVESIDWSKTMFWQDYAANVINPDGNDPGRRLNMDANDSGIQLNSDEFNPWRMSPPGSIDFSRLMPRQQRVFIPTTQAPQCSFQLQYSFGDLKSVTLPCLGDVKFATESVCGVFGQPEYCDVAARAAEILRQYKKD